MNWIKANKFLTGYFAVMLIGIGVLGYFFYSAASAYDAADENYQGKSAELNRLRHLPLYPNAKNLEVLQGQKEEAAELVAKFQAQLATKEFPTQEMTPAEFQDKLKLSVTAIVDKATKANVALPKEGKFYLGFDPYESRPPEKDAVAQLGRQLQAIQWVIEQLIEKKVTALVSLTRIPLPEEKSLASGNNNRRQGRPDRQEGGYRELVSKFPFDLVVTARQKNFADFLNVIVSADAPQFYIPRVVRIRNKNPKGPEREHASAALAQPVAPPTPALPGIVTPPIASAPAAPAVHLGYIAGEEQLDADLRLEIVEFEKPTTRAAKGAKGAK